MPKKRGNKRNNSPLAESETPPSIDAVPPSPRAQASVEPGVDAAPGDSPRKNSSPSKKDKKKEKKGKRDNSPTLAGDAKAADGSQAVPPTDQTAEAAATAAGAEAAPEQEGAGDGEGGIDEEDEGEEDVVIKYSKDNPFYKHPSSYTTFSTITDKKYKRRIFSLAKELHDYAESHQTLLRQRLTYEELMQGMLYPGEDLIPVKPLLIRDFVTTNVDDEIKSERFGVRMFLTNKRLFFLDADLDRVPMLEHAPEEELGLLTLSKLKVTYQVTDDVWFFPVPLSNLKGMSLDIHFATTAHGWIMQKRPWWAILLFVLSLGALAYGLQQGYVNEWVQDESGKQNQRLIIGAGIAAGLQPLVFLMLKMYGRSDFTPSMAQQRRVTLGCKDPITQNHVIFKLFLEDAYSMIDAKNYLSLMQEYAPHLSGFVLAE